MDLFVQRIEVEEGPGIVCVLQFSVVANEEGGDVVSCNERPDVLGVATDDNDDLDVIDCNTSLGV